MCLAAPLQTMANALIYLCSLSLSLSPSSPSVSLSSSLPLSINSLLFAFHLAAVSLSAVPSHTRAEAAAAAQWRSVLRDASAAVQPLIARLDSAVRLRAPALQNALLSVLCNLTAHHRKPSRTLSPPHSLSLLCNLTAHHRKPSRLSLLCYLTAHHRKP